VERSSDEKVLAGLTHVAVLFNMVGVIYILIMFIVYKQKSRFVYDHAKQALGLWVASFVVFRLLGLFMGAGFASLFAFSSPWTTGFIGSALILGLIVSGLGIATLVLVIIAAVKAFSGQDFRYPVIGDMVSRLGE